MSCGLWSERFGRNSFKAFVYISLNLPIEAESLTVQQHFQHLWRKFWSNAMKTPVRQSTNQSSSTKHLGATDVILVWMRPLSAILHLIRFVIWHAIKTECKDMSKTDRTARQVKAEIICLGMSFQTDIQLWWNYTKLLHARTKWLFMVINECCAFQPRCIGIKL